MTVLWQNGSPKEAKEQTNKTLWIGSVWISEHCVKDYSYGLKRIIDMMDIDKEFLFPFRDVDDGELVNIQMDCVSDHLQCPC